MCETDISFETAYYYTATMAMTNITMATITIAITITTVLRATYKGEPDFSFETANYYTATIATTGCYICLVNCPTRQFFVHWVSALIVDFYVPR